MSHMTLAIAPEKLKAYKKSARARLDQKQRQLTLMREEAWSKARQAARVLKEQFGATKVIAFGSLARTSGFNEISDIDLVVYGSDSVSFGRAWCALDRLESKFEFDLIEGESLAGQLLKEISREGVEL